MFVIDYLTCTNSNEITVSPFHSGHIGLMPDSEMTATLLQSDYNEGCEVCITPYQHNLSQLFYLRCILKEKTGVVHRLLKAIAALKINILSWESAVLESKNGHGVYLLLDWGTTRWPRPVEIPPNISNIFFPRFSGLVPPNDLRYLTLLRQILGQCGDVLSWTNDYAEGISLPRIAINDFKEDRRVATLGEVRIERTVERSQRHLSASGVKFKLSSRVESDARLASGRDGKHPLHYILLSDIQSKTLRMFIPRNGREKRMIHLGFSHKNRPGALCGITKLIARSGFSIFSGLVRKNTADRNILEATLEHPRREVSAKELSGDPEGWISEFLDVNAEGMRELLRYYEVRIGSPLYPRRSTIPERPLYSEDDPVPTGDFEIISYLDAERDIREMKTKLEEGILPNRKWVVDILLDPAWGLDGRPTVFLSYPRNAIRQAEVIKRRFGDRFHFREFQKPDRDKVTQGAIERIQGCQYLIGIWHHEEGGTDQLSPWMPFEYGLAMGNNKPCIILHYKDLPSRLVGRIDRNTLKIPYEDLRSDEEVIEILRIRCEPWTASHRHLTV